MLDCSIQNEKGIGEKTAKAFLSFGIASFRDLLFYYPRSYETFLPPVSIREADRYDFAAVRGTITESPHTQYVKKFQITEATAQDEMNGRIKLIWYRMPYLSKTLKPGETYIFRGKLEGSMGYRRMVQPKIIKVDEYEKMQQTLRPVYKGTKEVSSALIAKIMEKALPYLNELEETLPEDIRARQNLLSLPLAIKGLHFPENREEFIKARERIVFEEFYQFIREMNALKEGEDKEKNGFSAKRSGLTERFLSTLPYELTDGQKKILEDIEKDLSGPYRMNRLIQGDVGSGKTILAFLAMEEVIHAGYQSVLMAPTEVLAEQHYQKIVELNANGHLELSPILLVGSMTKKQKDQAYAMISSGMANFIIGTHAVFQEKVDYRNLGLVITDEQHRFGVHAREKLMDKGKRPHTIVMSATPIPRTLAMILYGDLDISVLKELPQNRKPIHNAVMDISYRPKCYKFLDGEIAKGHQCYVVCPMISSEGTETDNGENVIEYAKKLKSNLKEGTRIEILHGNLKAEEKEKIMTSFQKREIDVLVSTTVIEVGIDNPNATVMMIENAERFGLATLHQLRGRVGRGEAESYCLLINTSGTEESRSRLEFLSKSNDGFAIAEEDLKLRGPGDLFGIRQSGELSFKMADIYQDAKIMEAAQKEARTHALEENQKRIIL